MGIQDYLQYSITSKKIYGQFIQIPATFLLAQGKRLPRQYVHW